MKSSLWPNAAAHEQISSDSAGQVVSISSR